MKYIFLLFILITCKVYTQDEFGYIDENLSINWGDPIYDDFFSNSCNKSLNILKSDRSITKFCQLDYNDIMCSGKTIATTGCALTCLSMILKTEGINTSPSILNYYIKEKTLYNSYCGLPWTVVDSFKTQKLLFKGGILKNKKTYDTIKVLTQFKEIIKNGGYIVASVKNNGIECRHFILIYDFINTGDKRSDFIISDPQIHLSDTKIRKFSDYKPCYDTAQTRFVYYNKSTEKTPNPKFNISCQGAESPELKTSVPAYLIQGGFKSTLEENYCHKKWVITKISTKEKWVSDVNNPVFRFTSPGTYTISLAVRNEYGFDAEIKKITVVGETSKYINPGWKHFDKGGYLILNTVNYNEPCPTSKFVDGGCPDIGWLVGNNCLWCNCGFNISEGFTINLDNSDIVFIDKPLIAIRPINDLCDQNGFNIYLDDLYNSFISMYYNVNLNNTNIVEMSKNFKDVSYNHVQVVHIDQKLALFDIPPPIIPNYLHRLKFASGSVSQKIWEEYNKYFYYISDNLNFNNTSVFNGYDFAKNNITLENCNVSNSGIKVILSAGDNIIFKPNTSFKAGTYLNAKIEPKNKNTLKSLTVDTIIEKNNSINESKKIIINDTLNSFIKIYPNPSNGLFYVEINKDNQLSLLTLFDATGKTLLNKNSFTSNIQSIDISLFPTGMYILKAMINNKSYIAKIIKE